MPGAPTLGEVIGAARRRARRSRAALAAACGVPPAEVARWETTGAAPDAETLALAAADLGVVADELRVAAGDLPARLVAALARDPARALALADPAPPAPARPRLRPALTTALGALYQADCLAYLATLPRGSVDCVFADPPFNLGKDYGAAIDDARGAADYLAWCRAWIDEVVRVLAPGGAFFLYNLPRWNVHLAAHAARALELKHWIAVDIKLSLPIAGRLYPAHYALLYLSKGRPRVFAPPRQPLATCRHCGGELRDYGGYKDRMNPRGVNLTDVWSDIPPVRHRRYKRRGANQLALKMLDRVLDIATAPGDLVVDPFGGSGTTFVACELKGRRWSGCEVGTVAPIRARLADLDDERGQLAELRGRVNVLFTTAALALRRAKGHDSSRYRIEPKGDKP